jgi:hypothetical protein
MTSSYDHCARGKQIDGPKDIKGRNLESIAGAVKAPVRVPGSPRVRGLCAGIGGMA